MEGGSILQEVGCWRKIESCFWSKHSIFGVGSWSQCKSNWCQGGEEESNVGEKEVWVQGGSLLEKTTWVEV